MRIKKTDKIGTIHELPIVLVNLSELNKIKPKTSKQKNEYLKMFDKYKLFKSNLLIKDKNTIISNLNVINFNISEIEEQKSILSSINSFNRLINKKIIEVEENIRAGINVKENVKILKKEIGLEFDIPKNIRRTLRITNKSVFLIKYNTRQTENRIKFYSGQNYSFLIKDSFNSPYFMDYNSMQDLRKKDKSVYQLLLNMSVGLTNILNKDKKELSKKEPKKWKIKNNIYSKILKVINHNIEVATNRKYNKNLVTKDNNKKIVKINGEYPILMNVFDELIDLYIP